MKAGDHELEVLNPYENKYFCKHCGNTLTLPKAMAMTKEVEEEMTRTAFLDRFHNCVTPKARPL